MGFAGEGLDLLQEVLKPGIRKPLTEELMNSVVCGDFETQVV